MASHSPIHSKPSFQHAVEVRPNLGDGFVAVCHDLKITMSGPTQETVLLDMWFAIDAFYAECMVRGKTIPIGMKPHDRDIVLCPSANIQAKMALHQAFRDSGMSKGKLGQALGMDYSALNRLFDPRTGSRLDRIEAALNAMGRGLSVQLR